MRPVNSASYLVFLSRFAEVNTPKYLSTYPLLLPILCLKQLVAAMRPVNPHSQLTLLNKYIHTMCLTHSVTHFEWECICQFAVNVFVDQLVAAVHPVNPASYLTQCIYYSVLEIQLSHKIVD